MKKHNYCNSFTIPTCNTEVKKPDLIWLILITLVVVCLVIEMFFRQPPHGNQHLISPGTKSEIIKKLSAHKPQPLPLSTTVMITKGQYYYEWKGKWVKL